MTRINAIIFAAAGIAWLLYMSWSAGHSQGYQRGYDAGYAAGKGALAGM